MKCDLKLFVKWQRWKNEFHLPRKRVYSIISSDFIEFILHLRKQIATILLNSRYKRKNNANDSIQTMGKM